MENPDPPTALQIGRAIMECVLQWNRDMDDMKSPRQLYQEQVVALRNQAKQNWARMASHPSCEDSEALLESVMCVGGQLRDLKANHVATIERDTEAYMARVDARLGILFDEITDKFGFNLAVQRIQQRQTNLAKSGPLVDPVPASQTHSARHEATQSESHHTTIQPDAQAADRSVRAVDKSNALQPDETTAQRDIEIPEATAPESDDSDAQEFVDFTVLSEFQFPDIDAPGVEDTIEQPDITIQPDGRVPGRGVQEPDDSDTPKPNDTTTSQIKVQTPMTTVPKAESAVNAPVSTPSNKRKKSFNSSSKNTPKRARTSQSQSSQFPRTIDYEEVFQDGNAAIKHTIVRFENEWYILQCVEHGLTFKDKPIHAAAKHLSGKAHHGISGGHSLAIKHLGFRVLNCSEDLAEKNNKVTIEALRKGYRPVTTISQRAAQHPALDECRDPDEYSDTGEYFALKEYFAREEFDEQEDATYRGKDPVGMSSNGRNARNKKAKFEGIIDPKPGDIYSGFYSGSKVWYAVLVLPGVGADIDIDIGMPGTMQELGLTEPLPPCCDFDTQTGLLSWRKGYEDGGPCVNQRQFPVLYFDGLAFPDRSSVGWLEAKNLAPLDMNSPTFQLVPNYKSVLRFLKNRAARRTEATALGSTGLTGGSKTAPPDTEMADVGETPVTDGAAPAERVQDTRTEPPQSDIAQIEPRRIKQEEADETVHPVQEKDERADHGSSDTAQRDPLPTHNLEVAEASSATGPLLSDGLVLSDALPAPGEFGKLSEELPQSELEILSYNGTSDHVQSWFEPYGIPEVEQAPPTDESSVSAPNNPALSHESKPDPGSKQSHVSYAVSISSDSTDGSSSEATEQPPTAVDKPAISSSASSVPPQAQKKPTVLGETLLMKNAMEIMGTVLNDDDLYREITRIGPSPREEEEDDGGNSQTAEQPAQYPTADQLQETTPLPEAERPSGASSGQPTNTAQLTSTVQPVDTAGPMDTDQLARTAQPVSTTQPTPDLPQPSTNSAGQNGQTEMNRPQPLDSQPMNKPPPMSNSPAYVFQGIHPHVNTRPAYYDYLEARPPQQHASASSPPRPGSVALPSPQELKSGQQQVQLPPLDPGPLNTKDIQPSPKVAPSPSFTQSSRPPPGLAHAPPPVRPRIASWVAHNVPLGANYPVNTGVSQNQQSWSPQESQSQHSRGPNPAILGRQVTYRCPHCTKEYITQAWREKHILNVHRSH
ncbi:hypothetical protein QQZ08_009467 [Neonectria magnoliae]|uniref:C2H2-type domain-containing protein n=1 Tax=Neonectria magnoliae TaxID=2732573 RepID=A0ABR1HNT5_9HYPO